MKTLLAILAFTLIAHSPAQASEALASSIAQTGSDSTEITGDKRANVVKALDEELKNHAFNCVLIVGKKTPSAEVYKSLLEFIDLYGVKIYVSNDHSQPVITFNSSDSSQTSLVKVRTSADLKTVLTLEASTVVQVSTTSNTGTLLDPVFVTTTAPKLEFSAVCTY